MKRPTHIPTASRWQLLLLLTVLAGLSALPRLAFAQTPVVRVDSMDYTPPQTSFKPDSTRFGVPPYQVDNSLIPHILNIQDCVAISAASSARVRFTWTWVNKPLANLSPLYGVKISPPGTSCDANNMTETTVANGCDIIQSDKSFTNPLTASGEITDIDFKTLLGSYAADATGAACNADTETDAKIYFILPATTVGIGTTSTYYGAIMNVHLDLAPPPTPTVDTPEAGNENLRINWTQADPSDTTISGRVYWSDTEFLPADATSQPNHSDTMTGTTYQITGLQNGTTYYVSVTSVDANGNESGGSPIVKGTPVVTYDLWSTYQTDGGQEQGGYSPCNAQRNGRAGPLALLGALGLLVLFIARRRVRAGKLVIALVLAAPLALPAQADAASPQTMSADLRVSNYKPGIDNAFATKTPYADIMKDGGFGFGLQLDWRIWHGFGELGLGFGVGRWTHEGTALLADGTASNDKTNMTIIPLTLDAVYRFDILSDRYNFPVVPYVRAGAVYGLWWMTDAVGNISAYTSKAGKTVKALGGTGGLEGTIGLRLMLDAFEPGAARSFDIEMGVNHSYLFAEIQKLWLNDFGSSKSINLSDTVLAFGLAFDL